jgi:pimeloyl-ACP methyl ester carboxylesterase
VRDDTLRLADGRTIGLTDTEGDGTAVIWCHGGPGSRLEPVGYAADASAAGLRVIGIDRPGYGNSTPVPGRTIADWVPDALAVADHVGVDDFIAVGVSTGGAYALALAALAPARVRAVVACCALTDMRWAEGKAMMTGARIDEIWGAPNRDAACAVVEDVFGADGSGMLNQTSDVPLPAADMALITDPAWLEQMAAAFPAMFAQGVEGYVDDRLADGPGWGSFDVTAVTCPVTVLHGAADSIVPTAHAHHTAEIVPGAQLRIVDDLGHFSIINEVLGEVAKLA